jgi:hypothetical protein
MADKWITVGKSHYNATALKGTSKADFKKQFGHLPRWEVAYKQISGGKKTTKKSKSADE